MPSPTPLSTIDEGRDFCRLLMLPFPDADFCALNINLYRANDVIFGTIIPDSRARGLIAFSRFVQLNVSDGPIILDSRTRGLVAFSEMCIKQ